VFVKEENFSADLIKTSKQIERWRKSR